MNNKRKIFSMIFMFSLFLFGIACSGGMAPSSESENSSADGSGLAPIPSLPPNNTHDTDTRIFLNFYMGNECSRKVPFCCIGCNPNDFFAYLDGELTLDEFFVPEEWMYCRAHKPMPAIVLAYFKATPGERSCITHSDPNDPSTLDFVECEFIPESEAACHEIENVLLGTGSTP
jgi:hypothetical protein